MEIPPYPDEQDERDEIRDLRQALAEASAIAAQAAAKLAAYQTIIERAREWHEHVKVRKFSLAQNALSYLADAVTELATVENILKT